MQTFEGRSGTQLVPRTLAARAHPAAHFVHFYESDFELVARLEQYAAEGLRGDGSAVVIATHAHRSALEQRLEDSGFDLGVLRQTGAYVSLDAADVLSRFMVDGHPDAHLFRAAIIPVIEDASSEGRRVRAYGEMVALLVADGHSEAALELEELWNGLQQSYPFVLFCAYSLDLLAGERNETLVGDVCLTHGQVIPGASFAWLTDEDSRDRVVADLQQRSLWLEAEVVARERAERELARALRAEQEARAAVEASLRQREDFIAIASHELKTPLTTALGNVQLAARRLSREPGTTDAVNTAMTEAITSVKRLSALVSQLLDMSGYESERLPLDARRADLAPFIRTVVGSASRRYETHPITVTGIDSVECSFDGLRLEQVLSNLIDNAVKFSEPGSPIEVEIDVAEQHGRLRVEVAVRDHGCGVSIEQRSQIFDRFFQATAPVHHQGLGLGLYISRQIVELHGGGLMAEFPADGGSRFVLHLPV